MALVADLIANSLHAKKAEGKLRFISAVGPAVCFGCCRYFLNMLGACHLQERRTAGLCGVA